MPDILMQESKELEQRIEDLYLEAVRLRNFKAIEEVEIGLASVTLLVGNNSSGKSSFLQGLHWACRGASYIWYGDEESIAYSKLDYLPSSDCKHILHNGMLRSGDKTKKIHADFYWGKDRIPATISIQGTRNDVGIKTRITCKRNEIKRRFTVRESYFSAYIPGVAAIGTEEQLLADPILRRQAASGEASSVLRNILWKIKKVEERDLNLISDILSKIFGKIDLYVDFNDKEDIYISASYYRDDDSRREGLETLATGILKVLQILAYQFYFKPTLLLIDEPDAHLHPEHQRQLMRELHTLSAEMGTKIILTTHSPFLVEARDPKDELIWLKDGKVHSGDSKEISKLLGWGVLSEDILLYTEDTNTVALNALLGQWKIGKRVGICPVGGVDSLPKFKVAEATKEATGKSICILRDRDFMTDEEEKFWKSKYNKKDKKITALSTVQNDIESYFCDRKYLSHLLEVDVEKIGICLDTARQNVHSKKRVKKNFYSKRCIHRDKYSGKVGTSSDDDVWQSAQDKKEEIVGKWLLTELKEVFKREKVDITRLNNFEIPAGVELAKELKEELEKLI